MASDPTHTRPARYSVDPKCYELAAHFLADEADQSEERKRALAQHIQDAVEGFLE